MLFGFWVFSIHAGHFSFFCQAKILGVGRREGRGKRGGKDRRKEGKKGGRREGKKGRIASKKKKKNNFCRAPPGSMPLRKETGKITFT